MRSVKRRIAFEYPAISVANQTEADNAVPALISGGQCSFHLIPDQRLHAKIILNHERRSRNCSNLCWQIRPAWLNQAFVKLGRSLKTKPREKIMILPLIFQNRIV